MFGGNGGIIWAERTIDTHVAGLVIATVPLWIALIDRVLLHRTQPPIVLAGLAVGFIGAAILIGGGAIGRRHRPLPDSAVALAAAASWAAGSVYQRHAALPRRPFVAAGMEMVVAAACFMRRRAAAGELGDLDLRASPAPRSSRSPTSWCSGPGSGSRATCGCSASLARRWWRRTHT